MISGIDSAAAKVTRAEAHLNSLRSAIRDYAGTELAKFVPQTDSEEIVDISIEPPPAITIIAGEIVYQLRSALDHLAFDLVQKNSSGINLPKDWFKRCEFPLLVDVPTHGNPPTPYPIPVPYERFERMLPGISAAAFAFIESVQPYHRLGTANVLRLLAQLWILDKHRYLNVTIPRVAIHWQCQMSDGTVVDTVRGGFRHGAQIDKNALGDLDGVVVVKRQLLPYVTFDEPAVGDGNATLEVENLLEVCLEQVKRIIIPAFNFSRFAIEYQSVKQTKASQRHLQGRSYSPVTSFAKAQRKPRNPTEPRRFPGTNTSPGCADRQERLPFCWGSAPCCLRPSCRWDCSERRPAERRPSRDLHDVVDPPSGDPSRKAARLPLPSGAGSVLWSCGVVTRPRTETR